MPTPPMRASTTVHNTPPPATYSYSASVPLSIYRELAAQLQAAEARLDFLNSQNKQLATENQQLRQEIEKAVQSVLHLQQSVDSAPGRSRSYTHRPNKNFRTEPSRPVSGSLPMPRNSRPPTATQSAVEGSFQTREASSVSSEKLFTEQEEGRYRRRSQPESPSEISGRSLAIAILLIMVTAFGAGYLIVRPLLQSR